MIDVKDLYKYSKELDTLFVEDDNILREEFMVLLNTLYKNVDVAKNGIDGLDKFTHKKYHIIITDINMPQMNGIDMITKIRELNPEQKVVVISAHNESNTLISLIKAGVHNFLIKPIIQEDVIKALYSISRDAYIQQLNIDEVIDLHQEIVDTQKEIIFTMGAIGETRSKETGLHVKRVAEYSRLLALLYELGDEEAELLKMASPMHDIGKVGIPDNILHKPGKLNDEEWVIMKTHAMLGYEMLKNSSRPIMKTAAIVAKEHHEKWNGSGYPEGKSGEDIHIYGRITAIADVFDALGHDRSYKKAWKMDDILELFRKERGKHFDPILIDIFFANLDKFLKIKDEFKEHAEAV